MLNRSWIRLALATIPMTLFAPACGSSDDDGPPASDAASDVQMSTTDAGAGSDMAPSGTDSGTADAAAVNCSTLALVNSAPEIEGVRVAEARPAPTGGTIVPGLYYYTASRNYTGPGGATGGVNSFFKQTIKIESLGGGTFAVEMVDSERGDHTDRRIAGTMSTAGTQLNYQVTCPGMMAISVGFEADATSYKTWNASDNKIHVYTKQP